jgi:uncharacterized protein YbjT (DUF2867 family)
MKVVVIGATGGIGREVVTQSVAEGFDATAVARRPEAVTARGPRLRRCGAAKLAGKKL